MAIEFFAGLGIGIGYFVIVLAQMIVLTPILSRIRSAGLHVAIIGIVSVAGLAMTYAVQLHPSLRASLHFPYYALPFTAWYPFYHLGFFASKFGAGVQARSLATLGAVVWLTGMAASFSEGSYLAGLGITDFAVSQLKASSFAASIGLCLVIFGLSKMRDVSLPSVLCWMGQRSYFFYLFHLLTFRLISPALLKLPAIGAFQPAYIPALTVLSLLACALAAVIVERVIPAGLQIWVLGKAEEPVRAPRLA